MKNEQSALMAGHTAACTHFKKYKKHKKKITKNTSWDAGKEEGKKSASIEQLNFH